MGMTIEEAIKQLETYMLQIIEILVVWVIYSQKVREHESTRTLYRGNNK